LLDEFDILLEQRREWAFAFAFESHRETMIPSHSSKEKL
jgi:hypothetical protein